VRPAREHRVDALAERVMPTVAAAGVDLDAAADIALLVRPGSAAPAPYPTTAVTSISTFASASISALTSTAAIAGYTRPMTER
jgi:hypothetical protein